MADQPVTVEQQIALAKQQMQKEYPTEYADAPSVAPMGWLGRTLNRGSQAVTNPFTGSVYYNAPALEGQSQEGINNILAHELTHSRQIHDMPWTQKLGLPFQGLLRGFSGNNDYYNRPEELEAFQTERARTGKYQLNEPDPITGAPAGKDIPLPPMNGLKQAGGR